MQFHHYLNNFVATINENVENFYQLEVQTECKYFKKINYLQCCVKLLKNTQDVKDIINVQQYVDEIKKDNAETKKFQIRKALKRWQKADDFDFIAFLQAKFKKIKNTIPPVLSHQFKQFLTIFQEKYKNMFSEQQLTQNAAEIMDYLKQFNIGELQFSKFDFSLNQKQLNEKIVQQKEQYLFFQNEGKKEEQMLKELESLYKLK